MTQTLALKQAGPIVLDLVETINANRAYLSEIDGLIGDGDHGINMSKGFTQCGEALRAHPTLPGLAEGLETLAMTLLDGIGVARDDDKAFYWYQKAAEQGNASAQNNLGDCYDMGRGTAQEQGKGKTMATRHGGPRSQAGCQRTSIRLRPLCLAAYRASSARRTRVS